MYKEHPDLPRLDYSQTIWHYFSLSKFLGLISSSSLFFSRHDSYEDRYEGHLTKKDEEYFNKYSLDLDKTKADALGCVYSTCWTMAEQDEYVLWKSYATLQNGIAIKSSIERLIKSLDPNDEKIVYVSPIQYIDYDLDYSFAITSDFINMLAPHLSKRKYFSAEKELRALFWDHKAKFSSSPKGTYHKVDLDILIDCVFISPYSYPWFKDTISDLLKRYGINKCVKVSQI
jgi:hypothetical protein